MRSKIKLCPVCGALTTRIRQGKRDLARERATRRSQSTRPGVLLVKWSPAAGGTRGVRSLAHADSKDPRIQRIEERLKYLRNNHGLKEVIPIAGERRRSTRRLASVSSGTGSVLHSLDPGGSDDPAGLTMVRIDPAAKLQEVARQLRGAGVEYVETSPVRWLAASSTLDPRVSAQWGLQAIDWHNADRPSAKRIGVAVVDSGVDRSHPDLKKAIRAKDFHPGSNGNGDEVGHGTHVAGVIAAVANNRIGIAGVCNPRLHCWKVFDAHGDYDDLGYLRALGDIEKDKSIRVLNLSLGGVDKSKTEEDLLARLTARGVLVVAAMGNEYEEGNPTEYPAAYHGVMAVGAVGPAHRRSAFSNTGRHISLVAPGEGILSTLPRKTTPVRDETEYGAWDGTSFATPFVSGAAALVFARYPGYSSQQVRQKLEKTTTKPKAMRARHSQAYGYGELNLRKALGKKAGKKTKRK